jgi:hypothetical protein
LLAACATAQAGDLTDDALLAKARTALNDRSRAMESHGTLGLYHGRDVMIVSRCSDVCPVYTTRVVYFAVVPDKCDAAGGVEAKVMMPIGIAARREGFCIPRILFEKNAYTARPFAMSAK